jgi:ABC-2 type transport system permease protein
MTARFRDLIAAEWIKLWSLRSSVVAFAAGALVILGITVNGAVTDYRNYPTYSAEIHALFVPIWAIRDAFDLVAGMVLMLVTSSIGAIAILSEFSSGQIRTTFAAVPARHAVMAAKTLVVAVVMSVYGAVLAGTSFAVTQAILAERGAGLTLGYPGAFRAVVASALLAPVCALVGLGLATVVRHTAPTLVILTFVLLLLPFLVSDRHRWSATLLHLLPRAAWERLTELSDPFPSPFPAGIGGSWLTYAVWAAVAALAAVLVVGRRDV